MGRNFHNSKFRAALKTVAHVAMCCYFDESRGKGLVVGMKETAERGKIQPETGNQRRS